MLLADAPPVTLDMVTSTAGLARIEPAWRDLESLAGDAGIFATRVWHDAVSRHQARGAELLVMLARIGGAPAGLLPLARRRFLGLNTLVFLGSGLADYSIADYQDALLTGAPDDVVDTFVDRLVQEPWDLLWLQDLPSSSRLLELLPQRLERAGLRMLVSQGNDVHRVELPATWQEYTAGLSSSWRKEIGRKQRRFETELAGTCRLVRDRDQIEPAMRALFELHTQRWNSVGSPGIFDTAAARDFYLDLAYSMHEAASLYLSLLETPDGPVGAGLGFDFAGTRYAYTYGYSSAPQWEKASLGLLLDCVSIRSAIEAGLTRVDLLRNEGAYKQRYGVVSSHNYDLRAYRSLPAYLKDRAYWKLRDTAKRMLKGDGA